MFRKIYISLALLLVSIVLLFVSLVFSDGGVFLRKDLTSDYSLHKELIANSYNLVNKRDGRIIIKGIGDWIITEQYLYGCYKGSERYFLMNRKSADLEMFPNMHEISLKLKQLGLKTYDMSDEESFVHLKYHKRVYPLKH
jgi:hypothetical protein